MIDHRVRSIGRLAAGISLAVLAACESQPAAKPDVTVTTPSTPAAPAATTQVQTGGGQIQMTQCASPSNGNVHFRVGQSTLAVPAGIVQEAIPANMKPPLKKEEVKAELQAQASQGAGCPEKPLDAVLLLVKAELGDPLLEGTIGLLRSTKGNVTEKFAAFTRQLQSKPTKNCKPISGDLLACVGTETRGERETTVMYVITTDRSQVMNSGGPLATRCVLKGEQVQGCNLVDQVAGDMTFDATLNAGDYSTSKLRSAHAAATTQIEALRR